MEQLDICGIPNVPFAFPHNNVPKGAFRRRTVMTAHVWAFHGRENLFSRNILLAYEDSSVDCSSQARDYSQGNGASGSHG